MLENNSIPNSQDASLRPARWKVRQSPSVIEGDTVSAITQVIHPGPSSLLTMRYRWQHKTSWFHM